MCVKEMTGKKRKIVLYTQQKKKFSFGYRQAPTEYWFASTVHSLWPSNTHSACHQTSHFIEHTLDLISIFPSNIHIHSRHLFALGLFFFVSLPRPNRFRLIREIASIDQWRIFGKIVKFRLEITIWKESWRRYCWRFEEKWVKYIKPFCALWRKNSR